MPSLEGLDLREHMSLTCSESSRTDWVQWHLITRRRCQPRRAGGHREGKQEASFLVEAEGPEFRYPGEHAHAQTGRFHNARTDIV
jgi:hypothetical protein